MVFQTAQMHFCVQGLPLPVASPQAVKGKEPDCLSKGIWTTEGRIYLTEFFEDCLSARRSSVRPCFSYDGACCSGYLVRL